MESLQDRISTYEELADTKLPRKLPVITVLNGRNFRKTTSLLSKPYSEDYVKIMGETLIRLASEIDGTIFLYSFNDEIIIITRNDQHQETEPWYNNHIQKIISVSASLASVSFNSSAHKNNIKLLGEPIFIGKTFIVPNLSETINYLIYKQNQASQIAVSMACFYELLKQFKPEIVLQKLKNKSIDEKYDILFKECNVDLQTLPLSFWRGIAVYREIKLIKTNLNEDFKNKLCINTSLPFFSNDKNLIFDILNKNAIRN